LLTASSLALAACGGEDEDSNREASGGSEFVIDGSTGDASKNKSYRGVELTVENDSSGPVFVSFAGYCRGQTTGTEGAARLEKGQKARWRSCDKLIYGSEAKGTQSSLAWGDGAERFEVENPAAARPTFFFNDRDCFHNNREEDIIGGMSTGKPVRVENKRKGCGRAVIVERLSDSRDYIVFSAKVTDES
jgi:hypothetical protein